MSKQEQFLWVVQTMVLANAVNLSSDPERAAKYKTQISATGVYMIMDDAINTSEHIPDDLSATEAAHEFCTFRLQNLRDIEEGHG